MYSADNSAIGTDEIMFWTAYGFDRGSLPKPDHKMP